jgi:hypothetical protein
VTTLSRWQEWMIDRSRGFSLAQLPEARAPVASLNDERPSSGGPHLTRQVVRRWSHRLRRKIGDQV